MRTRKVYTLFTFQGKKEKKKKVVQVGGKSMVFTMEHNKVFTMQRRDMAFTVGMMFSTEEWLGGGKVKITFTSF